MTRLASGSAAGGATLVRGLGLIASTSVVVGGVIGNTAAAFLLDKTPRTATFTFTANGSGTLNYYISGVAAGNWTVTAGGQTQTVTATADGGLLVFTAPAGQITLTPQ